MSTGQPASEMRLITHAPLLVLRKTWRGFNVKKHIQRGCCRLPGRWFESMWELVWWSDKETKAQRLASSFWYCSHNIIILIAKVTPQEIAMRWWSRRPRSYQEPFHMSFSLCIDECLCSWEYGAVICHPAFNTVCSWRSFRVENHISNQCMSRNFLLKSFNFLYHKCWNANAPLEGNNAATLGLKVEGCAD